MINHSETINPEFHEFLTRQKKSNRNKQNLYKVGTATKAQTFSDQQKPIGTYGMSNIVNNGAEINENFFQPHRLRNK